MAKKDVSRLTVERALDKIVRIRERFAARVPYGPSREGLTPAEARKRIESMSPEQRLSFSKQMGTDEFLRMVEELYYGRT